MSDKKNIIPHVQMEGNFYERLCYFWKLSKVDLYNPGPDDIMEKEKKRNKKN